MENIEKEIKINDKIYKGEYKGKLCILYMGEHFSKINKKGIEILNVYIGDILEEDGTIFVFKNELYFNIVLSIFINIESKKEIENIFKVFMNIPISKMIKLRGDFAEVAFIKIFGGIKIFGEQKYDILLNKEYIKIKSFSESLGTVEIKLSQCSESKIIAIPIKMSNKGNTIIEWASQINDINFKEKIISKYKGTLSEKLKFQFGDPLELKPEIFKTPDSVKEINITYFIKEIIMGKYEK